MATQNKSDLEVNPSAGRRLVSWPLILIGLTLALLFVANSVSAWGRRNLDDVSDIKSHAEHIVDRALDRLDATDEQEIAIQGIVANSIEQLHAARGDRAFDRDALKSLILSDSIDRDAVEEFRAANMQRAEDMSRIVATGLADIVDVLTPEQREELREHFDKHHEHRGWGGWH